MEFATRVCSGQINKPWMIVIIQANIEQGPHVLELDHIAAK